MFFIVFLVSLLYWFYLSCTVGIVLVHDSIGYETLGRILYDGGLVEYLKQGPNREPLYPFLISIAMRAADIFSISYQTIQIIFQVFILSVTQFLLFVLLKQLRINRWITAITLLYMGFSPAIVNMAFSIYSEILTFPFILGIVLWSSYCWQNILKGNYSQIGFQAGGLALLFLGTTLIKGVYEYIFYFFFFIFIFPFFYAVWVKKGKECVIGSLLFLLIFGCVFKGGVAYYKGLNQRYNGEYVLADARGLFSLYASSARRTESMPFKRVLAGITFTAGSDTCRMFFDEQECYFWGASHYDDYGVPKLNEVRQTYPEGEVPGVMMSLAKEKVLAKPVPFIFWMGMEAVKMFFWESTQVGFVVYPGWLENIFFHTVFKDIIKFGLAVSSLAAFLFSIIYVYRHRGKLFNGGDEGGNFSGIFFVLLIIFCHVGMYSLFMTITRFALPIAPLYLLTIAFAVDRLSKGTARYSGVKEKVV